MATACTPDTCRRYQDPVSAELSLRDSAHEIREAGHVMGLDEMCGESIPGTAEMAFETADGLDTAAGILSEASRCPGPTEFKIGQRVIARTCYASITTGVLISLGIRKD